MPHPLSLCYLWQARDMSQVIRVSKRAGPVCHLLQHLGEQGLHLTLAEQQS